jgi:predicted ATPase
MSNLFFISGTHGSGKTTLINELKKDKSISGAFHLNDSYTRNVYSNDLLARQIAIIAAGIPNYSENRNSIFNRSLVDTLAYTSYMVTNQQLPGYIQLLNEKLLEDVKYRITHTFITAPDFELVGDEVRSSDKDFQLDIAERLEKIMNIYDLPYTLLSGSVSERLNRIKQVLAQYENIVCISKEQEAKRTQEYLKKIEDETLKTFCIESYLRGLKYPGTQTAEYLEDGVNLGFVKYRQEEGQYGSLVLSSIATLPQGKGKGVGTKLFSFIKRKIISSDNLYWLHVFVDQNAAAFYVRQGIDLSKFKFIKNERGAGWDVRLTREELNLL